MKYKIAICDDGDADRQYVLNMVDRWAVSAGHVVHTDIFTSAENFLFHYAEESDYDILLLDIEMGALAYNIQYRRTDNYTCQDKPDNAWHVYLATHEWHEPYDANNEGEYQYRR